MDASEKEQIIQNLQVLEQNLQQVLLQKQAFEMELEETKSAKREVEKSGEEVFKIIGQLLIKTDKKSTISDLENKEKLIDLRLKNFEKHEKAISEKIDVYQSKISQ